MTRLLPPEAIQWHEGMLLQPQHFQQAALRQERLLAFQLGATNPFPYGVINLELDHKALVEGVFRVLSLQAVLPDGLLVAHPLPGQKLELDLAPHQEVLKGGPRRVQLALPVGRDGAQGAGDLNRHASVDGPEVVDENTGEGSLFIPRLRPRLGLYLEQRVPDGYTGFPLAEIAFSGEVLTLTEFMPATLVVGRGSPLGMRCEALARRVREKAKALAQQVKAPSAAASDRRVLDARAAIQGLVGALPPLEALVACGRAHPFALYLAACGIAGAVSGLSSDLSPPVFPPYDHDQPNLSFQQVLTFVDHSLDLVQTGAKPEAFVLADGVFRLMLQEAWLTPRLVLGVRRRSGTTDRDMATWMGDCVIGSESRLPSIVGQRILGAKREAIEADPRLGIGSTRDLMLFAVDVDPTFILGGEPLVVHNRGDAQARRGPTEILLFVAAEEE